MRCLAVKGQFAVQVVVLAVPVSRLARREDLVAAVDGARKHLARMKRLDVLLEHEIVAERLLAEMTSRQRRRARSLVRRETVELTMRCCRSQLRQSVFVAAVGGPRTAAAASLGVGRGGCRGRGAGVWNAAARRGAQRRR